MNTYPTLPTAYDCDLKPITKIDIDRAVDGTGYAQSFSSDKVGGTVHHPYLSQADFATLMDFYIANRLLEFAYTDMHGVVRTMLFVARPKYRMEYGRQHVSVWVDMEEA